MYGVARAAGWDAAQDLCDETFDGWEIDFLALALTVFADADRDADRRFLARALGVLKE